MGEYDFDANVRPFLENLVKHPRLYVGPDGTHVGLILFSSEDKTMIKLGIGEIMDPYELAEYMGNLNYGSDTNRAGLGIG